MDDRTARWPTIVRVATFWIAYVAIIMAASIGEGMVRASSGKLLWGLTSCAALLALTFFFLRRERRTPRDIGLALTRGSIPRFLLGTLVGVATYGLNIAALAGLVGGLRLVAIPTVDWTAIALALCTTVALAGMEELGFRGYPLRTLVPRIGLWPAQVIVALAFTASHGMYGWPLNTMLFGVLPNAFLFGVAAIASGGLALPLGVHAGVNAARYAFGESGAGWFWNIAIEDSATARVSQVAPVTGIAITILMTLVVWWWGRLQPLARQTHVMDG
jgi:uncharacterized protein